MVKSKVIVAGQSVESEPMSFTTISEPWSFYKLEDGTVLKLKPVVTDIRKLETSDPITGLPQFMVRASQVVAIEPLPPKSEQN